MLPAIIYDAPAVPYSLQNLATATAIALTLPGSPWISLALAAGVLFLREMPLAIEGESPFLSAGDAALLSLIGFDFRTLAELILAVLAFFGLSFPWSNAVEKEVA